MKLLKSFIDGKSACDNAFFIEKKSPYTGKKISKINLGRENIVETAVISSNNALKKWKELPVSDRICYVKKMAEWIGSNCGKEREQTTLKNLIHKEVGKPFAESEIEVFESYDFATYFCLVAEHVLMPEKIKLDENLWPSKESYKIVDPLGVVVVIKPWNYPFEMFVWSVFPALLAGNTVILKPSEKATEVALKFSNMASFANLPDGVLNIVTGDAETGKLLVSNPNTNAVSFTGSVNTGKEVNKQCALLMKKSILELGGNDCAIVEPDCDLDLTANGLLWGSFTNAGQVCVGIKRVFVHESISEELIKKLVNKTKQLELDRDIGPMIDEKSLKEMEKFIFDIKEKGGKILTGGYQENSKSGYYYAPTIAINIKETMNIVSRECFGPLMPISIYENIEDIINIVNQSKYGLGASVWTKNKNHALKISQKLDVGMVWHNDVNVAFPAAPWGGRKDSGLEYELSPDSFKKYGNIKHICLENSVKNIQPWWFPYI